MLNLCVLGSGSGGNSVYVESENTKLLIDAGFSGKAISDRLQKIGRDIAHIDAIIVTHEHIDHCRGVTVLTKKYNTPLYTNRETFNALPGEIARKTEVQYFSTGSSFMLQDLSIETFSIPHDAVDPVGIVIRNEHRKITVVTDLGYVTHLIREKVKNSDALVVESNHDTEMLKAGPYPWFLKQRIKGRSGHLSNEECGGLLKDTIMTGRLKNVVLAHISETNNHPDIAKLTAQHILSDSNVQLSIAHQDRVSDFLLL